MSTHGNPKLGSVVKVKSKTSERMFEGEVVAIKSPTEYQVFLCKPKYSEYYHPAEMEVVYD